MCHIIHGTWRGSVFSMLLLAFPQLTTHLWPLPPLCNSLRQAGVRGGCRASGAEHPFHATLLLAFPRAPGSGLGWVGRAAPCHFLPA